MRKPPPISLRRWRSHPATQTHALQRVSPNYRDASEIPQCRAAYEQKLRELLNDVERGVLKGDLIKAIGARHPFLLAYQGGNDRALQQIYGEMIGKVIARRFSPAPLPPPPAPGEPIRLGIVSSFFTATPTGKFRSRAGSASSIAAAFM